ncbi:hypothetical protein [Mycoplasmopsis meleagridis]|uniref:hypothetical protein n=1 Tax=Mycoplasmopsis meleagridis TaxID=29561 RepID=UPI00073D846D|nr:hypothetical protein [Mycoplasmopsis meleagridis]KUH47337.1 hypothetical protein ASB56_01860 [Mycoplasmopsis meleagridis]
MKIKKIPLIFSSLTFLTIPFLVAFSCENNSNSSYSVFKNTYEKALNNQEYTIYLDEKQMQEEILNLKKAAKNKQLKFRYGQILENQENKIPQAYDKNKKQFTAEYLLARKLIKFKFNDEKLNDNVNFIYIDNIEEPNGVYLSFRLIDKSNPKYYLTTKLINLSDYIELIRYGNLHIHFSLQDKNNTNLDNIKNGLDINEAYQYNVNTNQEYIEGQDVFKNDK